MKDNITKNCYSCYFISFSNKGKYIISGKPSLNWNPQINVKNVFERPFYITEKN